MCSASTQLANRRFMPGGEMGWGILQPLPDGFSCNVAFAILTHNMQRLAAILREKEQQEADRCSGCIKKWFRFTADGGKSPQYREWVTIKFVPEG